LKEKVMIVVLASMLLGGCMSETTALEEENSLAETESEEDYMEENTAFFMEQLGLSESRAKGAARTM